MLLTKATTTLVYSYNNFEQFYLRYMAEEGPRIVDPGLLVRTTRFPITCLIIASILILPIDLDITSEEKSKQLIYQKELLARKDREAAKLNTKLESQLESQTSITVSMAEMTGELNKAV